MNKEELELWGKLDIPGWRSKWTAVNLPFEDICDGNFSIKHFQRIESVFNYFIRAITGIPGPNVYSRANFSRVVVDVVISLKTEILPLLRSLIRGLEELKAGKTGLTRLKRDLRNTQNRMAYLGQVISDLKGYREYRSLVKESERG